LQGNGDLGLEEFGLHWVAVCSQREGSFFKHQETEESANKRTLTIAEPRR
jgi:hypothetical protein